MQPFSNAMVARTVSNRHDVTAYAVSTQRYMASELMHLYPAEQKGTARQCNTAGMDAVPPCRLTWNTAHRPEAVQQAANAYVQHQYRSYSDASLCSLVRKHRGAIIQATAWQSGVYRVACKIDTSRQLCGDHYHAASEHRTKRFEQCYAALNNKSCRQYNGRAMHSALRSRQTLQARLSLSKTLCSWILFFNRPVEWQLL